VDCASPLLADQRYCLHCGVRRGAPRLDFSAFWHRAGGQDDAYADERNTSRGPVATPSRWGQSRWARAAVVSVVLGAGIAAGDLLAPGPSSSLASVSGPLQASVLSAIAASEGSKASSGSESPSPEARETGQSAEDNSSFQGASGSGALAEEAPTAEGEGRSGEATAPESAGSKGDSPADGGSEDQGPKGAGSEDDSSGSGSTIAGGNAGAGKTGPGESNGAGASEAPVPTTLLQQIKHVWLIMLSGSSFKQASKQKGSDPYLAKQLLPQGTLLSDYSLVAASPLANDIALLSGQSANSSTEEDCPTYEAVEPPTLEAKGLTEGLGCVYPAAAKTLADQATEAALTWKAYLQDMAPADTTSATGEAATTEAATTTCRHPLLGETEAAQTQAAGADYLTYRNPFVYFDSLLEGGACASDDVDLSSLSQNLAKPQSIPALSWVVPSACDDGQQTQCGPNHTTGLAAADAFLHEVLPPILATKAYRSHGLILITFDAGPPQQAHEGGAVVGALLLSPFVKRGEQDSHAFDNYSLLMSLERLYGVPLLGHANDEGLEGLGAGVYSTAAKAAQATTSSGRGATQSSG
jgi:hypothetical protein